MEKRFCAIMEEAQNMIQPNRKVYRYPNFDILIYSSRKSWGHGPRRLTPVPLRSNPPR